LEFAVQAFGLRQSVVILRPAFFAGRRTFGAVDRPREAGGKRIATFAAHIARVSINVKNNGQNCPFYTWRRFAPLTAEATVAP